MKKATLIFAALAIMFIVNSNSSACPPGAGWTDSGVKTLTYNGCTYEYRYCYAEIDGYHCIALSDIVVLAPCSYLDFENNASDIVDNMLIAIATDPYIIAWTGHTSVIIY